MVFRGGCSLLLTLGKLSTVEYVVMKNIKSHHRFLNQAKYQRGELPGGAPSSSMYADDDRPFQLDFNLLHHSQD
jgi:hypothetical protein